MRFLRLYHKVNDTITMRSFRKNSIPCGLILIVLHKASKRLIGLIDSDGCHGDAS
jgi:hypothetical protein